MYRTYDNQVDVNQEYSHSYLKRETDLESEMMKS